MRVGEIEELRSAHAKTFELDDGQRQAEFGYHRHFQRGGEWRDLAPTLRARGDRLESVEHFVHVQVDDRGIAVLDPELHAGIRWLTPERPRALAGPPTMRAAVDGVEWTWRHSRRGLKVEGTVERPQGPRRYTFPYEPVGDADVLRQDVGGNLVGNGFWVPRPIVQTARLRSHVAGPWEAGTDEVSFSWDDSRLEPGDFPYVIDPTTFSVLSSGEDGGTQASGESYPPSFWLATTTDTFAWAIKHFDGLAYWVYNAHIRWDTSTLPDDAIISAAEFRLYCGHVEPVVDSRSFQLEWRDFGAALDSGDHTATASATAHAGTLITAMTWGVNVLAAQNLGSISLSAKTGIRAHVSGGAPTGMNQVSISMFDHASNQEPRLVVTYSSPSEEAAGLAARQARTFVGSGF